MLFPEMDSGFLRQSLHHVCLSDGTGRCVSTSPHVVAVVMPVQASCDSRASHCNIEVLQHMYSRGRQGGGWGGVV